MTSEELHEIVEALRRFNTDTAHVEAKRARAGLPSRLWETISAFANSPGGGVIVLGLEESTGFAASGVEEPPRVQDALATLLGKMDPPIRAVVEPHEFEGEVLLVAEIPELPPHEKPCHYPGAGLTNGAFVRVGDGDRKLTAYEVQMLLAARGQPRDDERPEPRAAREDLDPALLDGLLEGARGPAGSVFREMTDDRALRTLRVLVSHDGRTVPSLAGLLALGAYPQQFYPSLGLTFVVYPTPRVGEPGPGGERFLDNVDFSGPVPRIVPSVLDRLRRNMRERSIVTGAGRQTLWEYPQTALREAVVNALAHRDLSQMSHGTPVQVQMFPDRMTITNPGGLFGPVTLDRLGEQGLSAARNQLLMKLLEDTPAPGEAGAVAENRGSGVGAMLAALRQAGMSPPEFVDRISSFSVTFPNHTLLDESTLTWLQHAPGQLSDSQRMALALMRRGETIDNAAYRKLTGLMDSRLASRELAELVNLGLVDQDGTRRWATYRLADDRQDVPVTASGPAGSTGRQRAPRRDRRAEVLAALERGPRGRADIARELGVEDAVATYWLRVLREEGQVEPTSASPRDPRQRYRLRPAGAAQRPSAAR